MPLEHIYQPREDSLLLAKAVAQHARGRVLDMGTGSGIQAATAAESRRVRAVAVADVSRRAIEYCEAHLRHPKIRWYFRSDLFRDIPGMYDTIIFNAPYLPWEPGLPRTVAGGRRGWETLARFLHDAKAHLRPKGQLLILFSSATNKPVVDGLILREGYAAEPLAEQRLEGFETLHIYRLMRQPGLARLEGKGLKGTTFLGRGRRGLVYTGTWKGVKVCIKLKRKDSAAIGRLENEARTLKAVNRLGIGPRLRLAGPDFVVYDYVPGAFLGGWLRTARKDQAVEALRQLLGQARVLDEAGIAKEEMLRPLKNAVVQKGKVTLIDFERSHRARDGRNVTQACQFILNSRRVLARKGVRVDPKQLIAAARAYKWKPGRKTFEGILALLPKS